LTWREIAMAVILATQTVQGGAFWYKLMNPPPAREATKDVMKASKDASEEGHTDNKAKQEEKTGKENGQGPPDNGAKEKEVTGAETEEKYVPNQNDQKKCNPERHHLCPHQYKFVPDIFDIDFYDSKENTKSLYKCTHRLLACQGKPQHSWKNSGPGVHTTKRIPKLYGSVHFATLTNKGKYKPSVMWNYDWKDFLLRGIPLNRGIEAIKEYSEIMKNKYSI